MGIDKWIFIFTAFLIFDTYHEGKYMSWLLSGKKYYRMLLYAFVGISLYMFIKKHPNESKGLLSNASELVKFLPIDNNAGDLLSPIFDFTNVSKKLESFTNIGGGGGGGGGAGGGGGGTGHNSNYVTPQMKRMMGSGNESTRRSVSESKKKYIASQQNWKCSYCGQQLDYTYEVDHKIELQDGGSNHVTNLAAVCRPCHAKKGYAHNLT